MSANRSWNWVKWLAVVLLIGGAFWFWKMKSTSAGKMADIEYRTNSIGRGDIIQSVTANGSIGPVRTVEVGSQVSGIITEILVDFNSPVKEGDLLARIDPATYERAVARAEADSANSRAALEMAEFNSKRSKELYQAKLISETEFTQTEVSLHQAQAQLKIREASVDSAKVDLERTAIHAPISGIVITRAVEAGQTVAASFSTPRLFSIANSLAKMQIELAVSEADIGGVDVGQKVNFTVEAFQGRAFKGVVKQVRFAPTTNQNVVTYTTVVEVDNSDLKLRPGMTANASLITAEKKGVLRIPLSALRFRPPEGANVAKVATPTPTPTPTPGNRTENVTGVTGVGAPAEAPTPPWRAENRRPTDEERQKWLASLTAEQREAYQQMRERMQQRMSGEGGGGGGGGGGGASSSSRSDLPTTRTVYLLERENLPSGGSRPLLKPVTVKTGISDGSAYTEILDGLKEGDVVATGAILPNAASPALTPAAGGSPFGGSPFGGGPPGGRRF